MFPIRHHDESGQGAVELALCLPVFLILIVATVEIANLAWFTVQLSNAAHAGAQFGSQSHANAADPPVAGGTKGVIETAAQNEVPFTITFPTAPTQSCACVDTSGNATAAACSTISTSSTSCPSPNVITDNLVVTVAATLTPLVHLPGLPSSYSLQTSASTPVINK